MKKQNCMTFFVLLIFLATSCHNLTPHGGGLTGPDEKRKDFVTMDKIQYKIQNTLRKEGFYLTGSGGGGYPAINSIYNGYITRSYKLSSVDEARSLICRFMEMYLTAFNNEKSIRPYLATFPFTSQNIEITISFIDDNHDMLTQPYIEAVYCMRGVVTYCTGDKQGKSIVLLKEPYELAYQTHQENNNKAYAH